jgi:hypothetical protein
MMTIVSSFAAMRSSRAWIIGALLAAALLLGGCSALRFVYNQGPDIVYWWLDGYADFDAAQTPRVRAAISDWFRWNRSTQLPDYAALLAQAEDEIAADATPEQLCRWNDTVRRRIVVAFDAAVPAIAELAPRLTPAQIEHIDRRFEKRNAEYRDDYRLGEDAAEQQRAATKRALERAEMMYGRLDEAQRERIARGVAASPFDAAVWFAERKARQADIVATLRRLRSEPLSTAEAEQAVRGLATRFSRSPRADYRSYEQTVTQYNCLFAAAVHNATTPAQRQAAQRKLKGWEAALRALIAEGSVSAPPAAR